MPCSSIRQVNKRKREGLTSTFFGVNWHKSKRKWRAVIRKDGKQVHLGEFTDEHQAARRYLEEARSYYGTNVRPNDDILATG